MDRETWMDLVGLGWTGDFDGWNVGQGDLVGLGWIWLDLLGHGDFDGWMVGQGEVGWMQRCDPESLLLSVGATRVS